LCRLETRGEKCFGCRSNACCMDQSAEQTKEPFQRAVLLLQDPPDLFENCRNFGVGQADRPIAPIEEEPQDLFVLIKPSVPFF
jgi:hypothetical protein